MRARELLGRYVNWADRYVMPRPRRVVFWEGFLRHGSPLAHWEAVLHLVKKIEAGDDLTPFLSDRIRRFGYVPAKDENAKPRGIEWGDKDFALNVFGAHHLHLRAKGSRELLYVVFSRNEAILVMVGDHKSFGDGSLARAVSESRLRTSYELKGILGPRHPRARHEQNKLPWYGFATADEVDGHMVLSANPSRAGTSPLHTGHADRVERMILRLEPQLDESGFGREAFERSGRPYPAAPNFEWVMQHCDLCLDETTTRTRFSMLTWRR